MKNYSTKTKQNLSNGFEFIRNDSIRYASLFSRGDLLVLIKKDGKFSVREL